MKLGKIVFFEVLAFMAVLITVMISLEMIPSFQPSRNNTSIGLYNSVSFPKNTIILVSNGSVKTTFKYSSYDPAIIVLGLSFQTTKPGYLTVYCNYRKVASIYVTSETLPMSFNMVSFSGADWIEPLSAMFGLNDLLFESEPKNGFVGDLTYQISLRGSR
jgi:hypothetical protein